MYSEFIHRHIYHKLIKNKQIDTEHYKEFCELNELYYNYLIKLKSLLRASPNRGIFFRNYLDLPSKKIFNITHEYIKYLKAVFMYYTLKDKMVSYETIAVKDSSNQYMGGLTNKYSYFDHYDNTRHLFLRKLKLTAGEIISNLYDSRYITLDSIKINISNTNYLIMLIRGLLYTISSQKISIADNISKTNIKDISFIKNTNDNRQDIVVNYELEILKITLNNLSKFKYIFIKQKRFIMQLYIDNMTQSSKTRQFSKYIINNILNFLDFSKF